MDNQNLSSNEKHPIIRVGDTVHRPAGWWTPSVHKLLKYLEDSNFKYSPRVLGFDDEGREILSFIEGESGKEGWTKVITDKGLAKYAKLLREYHDCIAGFKPTTDSVWAYKKGGLNEGEIMCHGDFGMWNIIWKDDEPVGIVDWDFVLPAKPEYDILYALEYSIPFRDDETCLKWHHFPKVPDRKRRVEVFLKAYGSPKISNLVNKVIDMEKTNGEYEKYLAERSLEPQATWVKEGDLGKIEEHVQWAKDNRELFDV